MLARRSGGSFHPWGTRTVVLPRRPTVDRPQSGSVIMRYVLRLRRWRILAKAVIVRALIIDITKDSVIRTGNQLSCFTAESSVVISVKESL